MPKPVDLDLPKTEVAPDPKVEKRTRRSFSTAYKLRIIAEADQCQHGELGALLRRENLYSNQLQAWRRQLAEGGEQALSKTAPGPKPKFSAEQRELEKLRRENARLKALNQRSCLCRARHNPERWFRALMCASATSALFRRRDPRWRSIAARCTRDADGLRSCGRPAGPARQRHSLAP